MTQTPIFNKRFTRNPKVRSQQIERFYGFKLLCLNVICK